MNPGLKQMLEAIHDRPLNRKELRDLMKRKCPCGSGKLYKNCHLKRDLMRSVQKQVKLMKERNGFYKRMEAKPRGVIKITKGGKEKEYKV